jgi:hypothetical protein
MATKKNTSARWEITVDDGTPRSYRDVKALAIEGAEYLKSMNPHAELTVRDIEGVDAAIAIKPQAVQVKR